MNPQKFPIIAREGWPFIAINVVALLLTFYFLSWYWSLPLVVLLAFIVQFFRDPSRNANHAPEAIVAAADGRVIKVCPAHDPYLDRPALLISTFMNVFNVHSNKSPINGRVAKIHYHPGKFFNAALDKASSDNERNALHLYRDNDQAEIICVQVAGLIARRILCYCQENDTLTTGQRYGFIRFGSRVDLYLPADTVAKVSCGDKVTSGVSVLAELAIS